MYKENLREIFNDFCKSKEFMLNPDKKIVDMLLNGILINESKFGLKYCPCRIKSESFEEDLEIICPCNFFNHETWSSKGMCWCSLFVKKVRFV